MVKKPITLTKKMPKPILGEFMVQAEELIQRYISEPYETADPNLRKEPFIRDKGTPVWVVVGYDLGGILRPRLRPRLL
jgi:hypothetical protein